MSSCSLGTFLYALPESILGTLRNACQSTKGQFSVSNPATDFTVFLLRLVEVHDAMDDLHGRVATEERDLVWKLFGG